jgi:hypothetical protein
MQGHRLVASYFILLARLNPLLPLVQQNSACNARFGIGFSCFCYPECRLRECGSRSLHRDLQFFNARDVHLPEVGRDVEVFHHWNSLLAAHVADCRSVMIRLWITEGTVPKGDVLMARLMM